MAADYGTLPSAAQDVLTDTGSPSSEPTQEPAPAGEPARTAEPETAGSASEQPAAEGQPQSRGRERASESDSEHGADAVGAVAPALPTILPVDGVGGTGDASTPLEASKIQPVASADGGVYDPRAGDTGGTTMPLAGSGECGSLFCGGPAGLLASVASPSQPPGSGGLGSGGSGESERPLIPITGAPGHGPGTFFSLTGGGGGAGGFVLLILVAVIASTLVRRPDWTTALRLPTAGWRPSAYPPPIESPG